MLVLLVGTVDVLLNVVREAEEVIGADELVDSVEVLSVDGDVVETTELDDLVDVLSVEGVATEEVVVDELVVLDVVDEAMLLGGVEVEVETMVEDELVLEALEEVELELVDTTEEVELLVEVADELDNTTEFGTSLAPQTPGELTAGPTTFFM